MRNTGWVAIALVACIAVAAPAGAQAVKAGVDAWTRGDFAGAVAQWRGPAVAGDADAQFNLGQAYKLGRGVPLDPALAESWFRKAALQGHPQAEDNYGFALFQAGHRLPGQHAQDQQDERQRAQAQAGRARRHMVFFQFKLGIEQIDLLAHAPFPSCLPGCRPSSRKAVPMARK